MATLDRPKLRPLSASRFDHEGRSYALIQDPLGAFTNPVLVPLDVFVQVCCHFEGELTLDEIIARVHAQTGAYLAPQALQRLIAELDTAMVLDGPTFASFQQSFRDKEERPAALAGRSYAASPETLRQQLGHYFASAKGAGPPALCPPAASAPPRLRGILSPHIDFNRGGPVYTWSYKELAEDTTIDTFVILGVAHQYCRRRFALTLKDFSTPLGAVRTDRQYVERIAQVAGSELFDDELAHKGEHSIEFQVVFLQYVLGKERGFSIVPILVGSFHDFLQRGVDPIDDPEVSRFVEALRLAERASGRNVAYIGGIDLCHVGPEFGDPAPVDARLQEMVRRFDSEMLHHAAAGDPANWFQTAANVANRWRVCGLAATYTMLHAIGPARGRLLQYDQALDERRTCCVSFASMVFHSPVGAPATEHSSTNGNRNT
ncbi:MAG: AmmeMemoRadiSam system protein B [Isosphaeraceae bacterium]